MPKLWEDSIETHRRAVRESILDAAWSLVRRHGLLAVSMSQIAAEAGIGRATLYKYFPDVESILEAHHARHVDEHLQRLTELRDQTTDAGDRLRTVLQEYARICYFRGRHGSDELAAILHRGATVHDASARLREILHDVLAAAAQAGQVRTDVDPSELAGFCMNALAAAGDAADEAAVTRLVDLTVDALRPSA